MGGTQDESEDEFRLAYLLVRQSLATPERANEEHSGDSPDAAEITEWINGTIKKVRACKDDSLQKIIPFLASYARALNSTPDESNKDSAEKIHAEELINAIARIQDDPTASDTARKFSENLIGQFTLNEINLREQEDPIHTIYSLDEDMSPAETTQQARMTIAVACSQIASKADDIIAIRAAVEPIKDFRERIADLREKEALRAGEEYTPPVVTDIYAPPSTTELLEWVSDCGFSKVELGEGASAEIIYKKLEPEVLAQINRLTSDASRAVDEKTKSSIWDIVTTAFRRLGKLVEPRKRNRQKSLFFSDGITHDPRSKEDRLDQSKPDHSLVAKERVEGAMLGYSTPEAKVVALCNLMLDVREERELRSRRLFDAKEQSGKEDDLLQEKRASKSTPSSKRTQF